MDIPHQYSPELFQLLVSAIPRLFKSKEDVLLFFEGAGVDDQVISDLWEIIKQDRKSIKKYEIVRTTLQKLNEKDDLYLRERREILKRVVEFKNFSTCYPDDQLIAKGLVSEIRDVINVKDSFTRMNIERKEERRKHIEEKDKKIQETIKRNAKIEDIKKELNSLFSDQDPQKRGLKLEKVLNNLFKIYGILVKESFSRNEEGCKGTVEQIDSVIELDGEIYLVEMKWKKDPIDTDDVSRHLGRIHYRGDARGIFISANGYTKAAIKICTEELQRKVIILSTLEEIVQLLEKNGDLVEFFKKKIQIAIIYKNPFKEILEK